MKKLVLFLLALPFALQLDAQCNVFNDGFESGSFGPGWTTAGPYVNTFPNTGSAVGTYHYSMSGTTSHYGGPYATFTPTAAGYISYRVRTSSTSVANCYFVIGDASTNVNNGILFNYVTAGGLRFYSGVFGDINIPISANTWYQVEIMNINWTAKTYDIYLNGVLQATGFGFRSQATTSLERFYVYNFNNATANYDQIIIGGAPISATSVLNSVSCFGGNDGSAALSPFGGNGIYTYSWAPSGGTGATATNLTAGVYTCTITDGLGCTGTTTVQVTEPLALLTTSTSSSITCNGGTAVVTVNSTGGTSPYTGTGTYTVSAGTYSYTVTDANGCTNTTSITITEPTALTATATGNAISCNGGNATVTVVGAGGTAPYTGEGSFTEQAGTYSYTLTDANGCTSTTSITITEPAAYTTTALETDITCFGGSDGAIDITVTGGTLPYTYDWNSGTYTTEDLTGLTAGSYFIVLTDANGCTVSGTMAVVQPSAIAHNGVVTNASGCTTNDGSIDLTTTGGTGAFTFVWNNAATTEDLIALDSGLYSVTITDANNCTSSATFTITEPPAPIVTYSEITDTVCQTTTSPFALSGATPIGGTWTGPGVTGNTFDPLNANVGSNLILYAYTDSVGCAGSASDSIWVDLCMNVASMTTPQEFTVYPNPTSGAFMITGAANSTISIFDVSGKLIFAQTLTSEKTEINLSGFANGVYLLKVENGSTVSTQKIILNK